MIAKEHLKFILSFLVGFLGYQLYILISGYTNNELSNADLIVNIALFIVVILILKDFWKYGDSK